MHEPLNPYDIPPPPPRRTPFYRTPNYRGRTPTGFLRQVCGAIGLGMSLYFVIVIGCSFDSYKLPDAIMGNFNGSTAVSAAIYFAGFIIPYYIISVLVDLPSSAALPWARVDLKLSVSAVCFGLGVSYGGAFFTQFFNAFIGSLTGYESSMPDIDTPDSLFGWILYGISVALLPAILEEMVFRGAIMQSLRQFGDRFAVLASALIFALGHGNLVQGPNTFVMGIVLGSLVIYTGSIKIGILLHFCNNFLSVLMQLAEETSGGLADSAYLVFFVAIVFVGIAAFAYILRAYPGLFRWRVGNYPVRGGMKTVHLLTAPMMIVYMLLCLAMIALSFSPV